MVNFGKTLRKLRVQSEMSQKDLAEKLGVTKSIISYYELSERMPSPDTLIKLADIFHVSTDYLLGRETELILDVSDLPMEDIKLLGSIVENMKKKKRESKEGE